MTPLNLNVRDSNIPSFLQQLLIKLLQVNTWWQSCTIIQRVSHGVDTHNTKSVCTDKIPTILPVVIKIQTLNSVQYRTGQKNGNADALSRYMVEATSVSQEEVEGVSGKPVTAGTQRSPDELNDDESRQGDNDGREAE